MPGVSGNLGCPRVNGLRGRTTMITADPPAQR
jgi:hypothetical protein